MSDVPPSGAVPPNGGTANQAAGETRTPFPAVRLFYAIGFGIVAWFVFWLVVVVALAQFVVVAINGKVNDELKNFSASLVQYLWELLAFITFVRDTQPFPIGPFPKVAAAA
jgi:Domain of unknown function (DUF4389)